MTHRAFATLLLGSAILVACAACGVENPNSGDAGLLVTPSGLKYHDEKFGDGEEARMGDTVSVHYIGKLQNGTKFDSSRDRRQPIVFVLGAHSVIKGWEEGINGMKVGGKRKLVIPPDLAYGDRGSGSVIPPRAVLSFDVELVKVVHPTDLPGIKPPDNSGKSSDGKPDAAPKDKAEEK
jgi:hypothetical protein